MTITGLTYQKKLENNHKTQRNPRNTVHLQPQFGMTYFIEENLAFKTSRVT